ncbi:response regulator [candidate division KSB1 bacterium]|nr:response regulator [candidate division KSB1 bacterium]
MSNKILIVDDEKSQREMLGGYLKKRGHTIHAAQHGLEALEILRQQAIDLVLTDMRMPELDGAELLKQIKALNPNIDVIMMTAYGSIEDATAAMKNGAVDYITKPVDLEQLELTLSRALEHKQLVSENKRLRQLVNERLSFEGIISTSPAMEQALNIAARVAESHATVLITGESGTGKELVARAIHYASNRRDQPFVAVNMAALSDNLVESELFGHEKGAFTGAQQQRQGRFEAANHGTLFIDEVGDIPLHTQVKLLRVLQEQQIERIGSSTPFSIDVRVLAATNHPLEEQVKNGLFRQDLYYRLNVVNIHLPPLRQRREDIPVLADHFIRRYADQNQKQIDGFSREALDRLMKYDYPGNVRELENIIEQVVVLSRDEIIQVNDLPLGVQNACETDNYSLSNGSFKERVEAFEKKLISEALRKANGIQTRAADLLGMSERHLRYKLKKYTIQNKIPF